MPALPKPIGDYFEANRSFDVDRMLAPFAPDALVHDERRDHRGTDEIRAWIEQATVGTRAIATPQAVVAEGDKHHVTAEVAGAFPGSPIALTFHFRLGEAGIAELAID